jgi:hypothetical protein
MFQLKPIDAAAIPKALEKAERYRLLNEPEEAESICLDVLAIEPDNQAAILTLLALTDQFRHGGDPYTRAQSWCRGCTASTLPLLRRHHCERQICAPRQGRPRQQPHRLQFCTAMEGYEKAEVIRPLQNDDAILLEHRARIIMKHHLEMAEESYEPLLLEEFAP